MSQHNTISTEDCWLWALKVTIDDYGVFYSQWAHRLLFEIYKGRIPDGLQIDHLCNTPRCINPDHLEAVTKLENLRRSWVKRKKDVCPKGHPMSGDNLMIEKCSGYRRCKICRQIANRKADRKMRLNRKSKESMYEQHRAD